MRRFPFFQLGYVSSANSASMGALAATEKNCATTNSLVELRPHGSRSVESVRPASLVCKCSEPDCILEAGLTGDRCSHALLLLPNTVPISGAQNKPQQVMVRFEQIPLQVRLHAVFLSREFGNIVHSICSR